MISAVTIDFWQTLLVDPEHNLTNGRRHRLEGVGLSLARSGQRVTYQALERAYEESGRRLAQIWAGREDIFASEQVRLFLDCLKPGLSASLPEEILQTIEEVYAGPALHFPPVLAPGAAQAIRAISERGLPLAIVSNTGRTPGVILRKVLASHGLLEHFTALTFSDEARVRKPHPRIFQRTLAALGADAAQAVHVGDDPEADVAGARAVGMRAIHLSADGQPSAADATIRSLFELPEAVARL